MIPWSLSRLEFNIFEFRSGHRLRHQYNGVLVFSVPIDYERSIRKLICLFRSSSSQHHQLCATMRLLMMISRFFLPNFQSFYLIHLCGASWQQQLASLPHFPLFLSPSPMAILNCTRIGGTKWKFGVKCIVICLVLRFSSRYFFYIFVRRCGIKVEWDCVCVLASNRSHDIWALFQVLK